ncbi:MAG TPA: YegP family protein [Nitrososphaera sp.]|nr:YegP family protein [Nitrososphaera sp.]
MAVSRYHVELFLGTDREHYVRVKHSNGRVILSSEGYSTKWNARRFARKLARVFNVEVEEVSA